MTEKGAVVVIADDLSGAAELAGVAFQRGLTAEVQRTFEARSDAQVVTVDTDSRGLAAAEAAARVRAIVQQARKAQLAWLYKKVDSILRGNVRAEIEAALDAAGLKRAILVPANPSRGRTIFQGRYFVEGQPLDQTPMAADPDHPRRTSDVTALLGSSGAHPIYNLAPGAVFPTSGIVIPDVQSPADLQVLAGKAGDETLLAGAADFFEALLRIRGNLSNPCSNAALSILQAPALLVCGSRVAWPERHAACIAANIPVGMADGSGSKLREFGSMLLGVGDRPVNANADLKAIASLASRLIMELDVRTVLVEGGATAAALADEIFWTRFKVVASAPAGVGVLQPESPAAPLVLIKPGSYPWPAEIWQQFCRCGR